MYSLQALRQAHCFRAYEVPLGFRTD